MEPNNKPLIPVPRRLAPVHRSYGSLATYHDQSSAAATTSTEPFDTIVTCQHWGNFRWLKPLKRMGFEYTDTHHFPVTYYERTGT